MISLVLRDAGVDHLHSTAYLYNSHIDATIPQRQTNEPTTYTAVMKVVFDCLSLVRMQLLPF
jgi:hypothetical protein